MNTKRIHIVIPADLASEIDTLVGKRGRSGFLAEAARKELNRLRMLKALEKAAGSWKDKDHPELRKGAARWVESIRKEDEQRLQPVTDHANR
jgi:Arc/MetJ-type ribon-helix-helix transcriptional regulator